MADIYPWQQALWSQLGGRAQHAHAYLLYGPAGIGKRALAEHWAAQLLCQRPAAAGACGECKACQLLAAGTHPDYFVLEPEEAKVPPSALRLRLAPVASALAVTLTRAEAPVDRGR